MFLQNLLLPEAFQGEHAEAPYFEGWYFRMQNGTHFLSLIPGICLGADSHAYIQILNAEQGISHYWRYPPSAFQFRRDRFEISIEENIFSSECIRLRDPRLQGEIHFANRVPFSPHPLHTGMMGPFAFFPHMQCSHGVVTIQSTLAGSLADDSGEMDFTGGMGYVEKDWGKSFPQPYLWTQAHLDGGTFMLCLARVPVPGGAMTGLLSFLFTGEKRFFFSTYTGSRPSSICRTEDGTLHLSFRTPLHRLLLSLLMHEGLPLKAPGTHGMERKIREDPHAFLSIRLTACNGKTVFQGQSTDAGAEVVGDIFSLA